MKSSATMATGVFWSLVLLLFVLWALGVVTSTTAGGFVHVLLAVAIAAVLVRVIQGRRTLGDSK